MGGSSTERRSAWPIVSRRSTHLHQLRHLYGSLPGALSRHESPGGRVSWAARPGAPEPDSRVGRGRAVDDARSDSGRSCDRVSGLRAGVPDRRDHHRRRCRWRSPTPRAVRSSTCRLKTAGTRSTSTRGPRRRSRARRPGVKDMPGTSPGGRKPGRAGAPGSASGPKTFALHASQPVRSARTPGSTSAWSPKGRYDEAERVASESNPFPSICGRVCTAPCEAACRRAEFDAPIAIRDLKRFAMDHGTLRTRRVFLATQQYDASAWRSSAPGRPVSALPTIWRVADTR